MKNKSYSSYHQKIKKMSQLALFLAIGIILSILESLVPIPVPVPGVRLGLANTVGLVLLYYYSPKEYISISFPDENIGFPYFKKGTMYKGMELGKRYTLEELEL